MMPRMSAAFAGWQQKITCIRRTQEVVDGLVTERSAPFVFRGTIQPLQAKEIELKPEGQRAWEWLQIHCPPTLKFDDNDRISYNGRLYKIMGLKDYSINNYLEYHAVRDFQDLACCPS